MVDCKICNRTFVSLKGLAFHLAKIHKFSNTKIYYDEYIAKPTICPYCKITETAYQSIGVGYTDCCPNITCVNAKIKKTKLERYGDENYNNKDKGLESWKNKPQTEKDAVLQKRTETCLQKYGTINGGNSPEALTKINKIWADMTPEEKNECVLKNRRTKFERYGDENWSNSNQMRQTRIDKGEWVSIEDSKELRNYKKLVDRYTRKTAKKLYAEWSGYDYYDGEYILPYKTQKVSVGFKPSIDHKISKVYGFLHGYTPEQLADINNLCITKHRINAKKCQDTEIEFKMKYQYMTLLEYKPSI